MVDDRYRRHPDGFDERRSARRDDDADFERYARAADPDYYGRDDFSREPYANARRARSGRDARPRDPWGRDKYPGNSSDEFGRNRGYEFRRQPEDRWGRGMYPGNTNAESADAWEFGLPPEDRFGTVGARGSEFGWEGYRGRGPRGYRRSDERIRDDVSDRLADDPWVDASAIEVAVTDAEVTLTGSVVSRDQKRRAEDIADAVSGVLNVQNSIRVDHGTPYGAAGRDAERSSGTLGSPLGGVTTSGPSDRER